MKIAIFGSRTLTGNLDPLIAAAIDRLKAKEIITAGEPEGVCNSAREFARRNAIPLKLYFCDLRRNAGKYHWRSKAVLTDCNFCLFLWDGTSKGTRNEITLAKKLKVEFEILTLTDPVYYAKHTLPEPEGDKRVKYLL